MPVNENSYQNGKVYKIWSLDTNDIYVGSSCDTLSNRFCKHKSHYKKWKEGDKRRYCSSYILFDQVGVENCKIELIKNFPCNSKTELNREEGKVMREYKDIIVNKIQSGRTQKEYNEEYKKKIAENAKEYREEHKEEIKKYREEHKEEIKEKSKEYREIHKEELSKQRKEYYEIHKEEINKKHECECGGKFTHSNKTIHEKSKRHQSFLKSQ